jgi:hypothetical protein
MGILTPNMTRKSKISRLPASIRNSLNLRLLDGEMGKHLVLWLNSLDETKALIATQFKGRPISEQNLSEWRRSGFLDWQQKQETREQIRHFLDISGALHSPLRDRIIPERLYSLLAAQLASETTQLLAETTDHKKAFRYIGRAARHLNLLHTANTAAAREFRTRHIQKKLEDLLMADILAMTPIPPSQTRP